MLDCLQDAQRRVVQSTGAERHDAVAAYRTVLTQFNGLILRGTIPEKDPCFE
jgi:hypothetical protein